MPEGKVHYLIRTFLFQLLRDALGPDHSLGCDQFVYWLPTNPRRCLAPDVFVKLGVPDSLFGTWKTWHHGAPDLALECVSPNEGDGMEWSEKLARYAELGVQELVRFDPEEPEGHRLRVWDRIDEDLVEREVVDDRTPCLTLGWTWVVCRVESLPVGLRFKDANGDLVPTRDEAARAREEAATARVEELEAEVRRLREAAKP
jgi:Uma2 family endonuclease